MAYIDDFNVADVITETWERLDESYKATVGGWDVDDDGAVDEFLGLRFRQGNHEVVVGNVDLALVYQHGLVVTSESREALEAWLRDFDMSDADVNTNVRIVQII